MNTSWMDPMNPLSWEALALNLILHCPGNTVSFEMFCFCNCLLKANLPNKIWLQRFLPKKLITFQIHTYLIHTEFGSMLINHFASNPKTLTFSLLWNQRIDFYWELGWNLCENGVDFPSCFLWPARDCSVTSLHNGSSPHHVTASRRVTHLIHVSSPTTVLFGVQKFTNETMDICIFRL